MGGVVSSWELIWRCGKAVCSPPSPHVPSHKRRNVNAKCNILIFCGEYNADIRRRRGGAMVRLCWLKDDREVSVTSSMSKVPALEAAVVCPFFKNCTPSSIRCEGFDKDSTMAFMYPSEKSGTAKGVLKRAGYYCSARYAQCHHYKALMEEKYGKE